MGQYVCYRTTKAFFVHTAPCPVRFRELSCDDERWGFGMSAINWKGKRHRYAEGRDSLVA